MHLDEQSGPAAGAATRTADDRDAASARAVSVVAAIPARWASTRLPGKPLRRIAGRPMIEHVYRRTLSAAGVDRVVVLTDHEAVLEAVRGFGGEAEMTPESCASGSDRIAWAARGWSEQAVINVQGDEPLIDPRAVERLAAHLRRHRGDPMVTLAAPIAGGEADDPHRVKVVTDRAGYALYFSRAAIPYARDRDDAPRPTLGHVGIYGYRREALLELAGLEPTPLERCEKLEQLRALENGIRIRVLHVDSAAAGVDTEEDLARVERILSRDSSATGQEDQR